MEHSPEDLKTMIKAIERTMSKKAHSWAKYDTQPKSVIACTHWFMNVLNTLDHGATGNLDEAVAIIKEAYK